MPKAEHPLPPWVFPLPSNLPMEGTAVHFTSCDEILNAIHVEWESDAIVGTHHDDSSNLLRACRVLVERISHTYARLFKTLELWPAIEKMCRCADGIYANAIPPSGLLTTANRRHLKRYHSLHQPSSQTPISSTTSRPHLPSTAHTPFLPPHQCQDTFLNLSAHDPAAAAD